MNICRFGNNNFNDYKKYLTSVVSFGKLGHLFTSLSNAFNSTNNIDMPDYLPENITDISSMFCCSIFNKNIDKWNVSNITNMNCLFFRCGTFNQNLNNWNVSNVINMESMFSYCTTFNQNLNNWNVSNVLNMESMFSYCNTFNQNLNNWNVSNKCNIKNMFNFCSKLNNAFIIKIKLN